MRYPVSFDNMKRQLDVKHYQFSMSVFFMATDGQLGTGYKNRRIWLWVFYVPCIYSVNSKAIWGLLYVITDRAERKWGLSCVS
ncbi:hypothetical protein BGZ60DRAFT_402533 [Tricladium varicosporioides]|nr:hypothetical protein BGZ60DRAFT_402533 [Hymenoscyphus varicosporioides]